jgi:hypothetical protein
MEVIPLLQFSKKRVNFFYHVFAQGSILIIRSEAKRFCGKITLCCLQHVIREVRLTDIV